MFTRMFASKSFLFLMIVLGWKMLIVFSQNKGLQEEGKEGLDHGPFGWEMPCLTLHCSLHRFEVE